MSKQMEEPAFPLKAPMSNDFQGMTLRDYFAAKAMQGLFSCGKAHDEHTAHVTAKASYLMADAMLKAREA